MRPPRGPIRAFHDDALSSARPPAPGSGRLARALAAAALLGLAGPAAADDGLRVVASIKPVHSLASAVMAGAGEPYLIVRGAASPHAFDFRPSDAAALEQADVVFLIGDPIATALSRSLDALAGQARAVALFDAPGVARRALREGGAFEAHAHDHGDHDDHDDHGDESHDDGEAAHGHDDHGDDHEAAHGHDDHDHHGDEDHDDHGDDREAAHDHDDHGDGAFDAHIWLDPVNGQAMTRAIAAALIEADPANAALYEANAAALLDRLDRLTDEIAETVAPARGAPFIVFHDAYRHFEDRFGLTAVGSIAVDPERSPGPRRVEELRAKVRDLGVVCVFAEPQFDRRLVDVVVEGTPARTGVVDPLGAAIEDGPDLYVALLRDMASSFRNCLAPAGG